MVCFGASKGRNNRRIVRFGGDLGLLGRGELPVVEAEDVKMC